MPARVADGWAHQYPRAHMGPEALRTHGGTRLPGPLLAHHPCGQGSSPLPGCPGLLCGDRGRLGAKSEDGREVCSHKYRARHILPSPLFSPCMRTTFTPPPCLDTRAAAACTMWSTDLDGCALQTLRNRRDVVVRHPRGTLTHPPSCPVIAVQEKRIGAAAAAAAAAADVTRWQAAYRRAAA